MSSRKWSLASSFLYLGENVSNAELVVDRFTVKCAWNAELDVGRFIVILRQQILSSPLWESTLSWLGLTWPHKLFWQVFTSHHEHSDECLKRGVDKKSRSCLFSSLECQDKKLWMRVNLDWIVNVLLALISRWGDLIVKGRHFSLQMRIWCS